MNDGDLPVAAAQRADARTAAAEGVVLNAPVDYRLLERRRFIGGSDCAAIIGVSPWKTALRCYLEKRGEAEGTGREADPDLQDLLETGKEMEPVIVNRLIRRYGVKVTKRSTPEKPNRYSDAEHPFLACEIDFEWEVTAALAARFNLPESLIGTIQNGEAKKVHQFARAQFGEAETDEVPVQYAAQAAHGLGITKRQLTLFAVQLGDELTVYWIWRDEQQIAALRSRMVGFWNDNVLAGVPPEPMDLPDVYMLFRKAPPVTVQASAEIVEACVELETAKQAEAAAKDRQVELKYQIGRFMLGESGMLLGNKGKLLPTPNTPPGKHALMHAGAPLLLVNLQHQTRLDGDRLKEERPEIAAEYVKAVSFFRFDKPRKKR